MNETSFAPSAVSERLILVNGVEHDRSQPAVDATDPGILRGDGAFEVVRLYGGTPFAADEHLARLGRSCSGIDLPLADDAVAEELESFCRLVGERDLYVRIVVTRAGRRLLLEEPLIAFPERMRLLPVRHELTPLLHGVKSLSYAAHVHAKRLAQAEGCDDALFVSAQTGRVLEGPFTSFCWSRGGRLFAPPLSDGILDSITRRVLMEVAEVTEVPTHEGDLRSADGACVLGTGPEARPVAEIKGVVAFERTADAIGDASRRVHERIGERVAQARRAG
jgi:branched-chain amino acid aminotransferase